MGPPAQPRGPWTGRWLLLVAATTLLLVHSTHGLGAEKYKGYQVLRVYPSSQEQMNIMRDAETKGHGQVQIWNQRTKRSMFSLDMILSPDKVEEMASLVQFLQIPHETLVPELQEALERHAQETGQDLGGATFSLSRYNTYQQIVDWLFEMAQSHLDMLQVIQVATSWEGRPVYAVKITSGVPPIRASRRGKPAIWMDAGIHSNEWIGPATMLYFIHQFITEATNKPELQEVLNHFDLYILPVMNVDGYVYTWTEDRLWRKSRSVHDQTVPSECVGVDMNRNWGHMWGVATGMSSDPCSRIYGGPQAESEPEVQGVIRFLQSHRTTIKGYLAYHSYSQYWMTPYSYTTEKPQDYEELLEMGQRVCDAIKSVSGTRYTAGSIADLVGEASGSSVDYTYGQMGIKHSFGVELRDSGLFGTLLPPSAILDNSRESLAGFVEFAKALEEKL